MLYWFYKGKKANYHCHLHAHSLLIKRWKLLILCIRTETAGNWFINMEAWIWLKPESLCPSSATRVPSLTPCVVTHCNSTNSAPTQSLHLGLEARVWEKPKV